jgi:adenylate kinase
MRIVLLGPPGSGKGTQAELLVEKLKLPHISTGELLRSAAKAGTELGQKAKMIIDRGDLVSDEIMLGLITERLSLDDVKNGFILDGYPRNINQAKALDKILDRQGQSMVEVLHIDLDAELVVQRIAGRAAQEHRSDDVEEVVRNRLRIYTEQTAPVVEYYAARGVLSRVLGDGTAEEVFQRIMSVLSMHSES